MATKIKKEKAAVKSAVKYVSFRKKEDFVPLKLKRDGSVQIVQKDLAASLIARKKAVEAKGVEFEVVPSDLKRIDDDVKK